MRDLAAKIQQLATEAFQYRGERAAKDIFLLEWRMWSLAYGINLLKEEGTDQWLALGGGGAPPAGER